jgi:subtilisin family serine protease
MPLERPIPRFPRRPGVVLAAVFVASLAGCATAGGPATAPGTSAPVAAAEDQLLVLLPPRPQSVWQQQSAEIAAQYGLRQVAAWTVGALGGAPCVVYESPPGRPPADIARRLAADPRIDVAQPVHRFRVLAAGDSPYNDPYAGLQRGIEELSLAAAHAVATGKDVRVGIVDTGLDLDHPDLRGRIAGAGNFVARGEQSFTSDVHGTAVAGIVAAGANNQVGIVGVAPGALLWAFKACWQEGSPGEAFCDSYTLAQAVDAAVKADVQVLNLSLTGPADPFLERLLVAALSRRTVVVAAFDGTMADGGFPASLPGVLAVGAEPRQPTLAAGTAAPLVGPAVDVLSTAPRAAYDFFHGSSFAAAHAAGIAALLIEVQPDLTPAEVGAALRAGTRRDAQGAVRLDPCAALGRVLGRPACAPR